MEKEVSFTVACKDFFGFHSGETLHEFMMEIKALSAEDKAEIKAGLEQLGYKIKS